MTGESLRLSLTDCPESEALARLIDDGADWYDPGGPDSLISHLDDCKACFRVFVDSYRYLGSRRAPARSNLLNATRPDEIE